MIAFIIKNDFISLQWIKIVTLLLLLSQLHLFPFSLGSEKKPHNVCTNPPDIFISVKSKSVDFTPPHYQCINSIPNNANRNQMLLQTSFFNDPSVRYQIRMNILKNVFLWSIKRKSAHVAITNERSTSLLTQLYLQCTITA